MGINVAQVLRAWAVRDPSRTALVTFEQGVRHELSYGMLDHRAQVAATTLSRAGVRRGSHVALTLQNGLDFLDSWFGGLYLGATLLPVPPMSAPPELRFRLERARCTALICDATTEALAQAATHELPSVQVLPATSLVPTTGGGEPHGAPADLSADAPAMMLFTSGTTGTPKAAMISHASLLTHTAALVHHVLRLGEADTVLASLPLTHSYGIRMTLLAPFFAGARAVLLARFQTGRVLQLLDAERVSWFPGVPTMFHALSHAGGPRADQGALRWCLSAGAPLPEAVREAAETTLLAPVRQGYGMTEATFTSVATPQDATDEGNVGRPVFGVEVRILDAEGRPLPPGERGEVCVRGQNVMLGYYDEPAATAEALREGFMHSGDVGYLDKRGTLFVVDRIKDMILRGGFNVYPAEVEAVLVSHPRVRASVVVGIADPHYGEEVVAVVTPVPGATLDARELDDFCRENLSGTKRPRLFGVLEELPVGASGKVLRRAVREAVRQGDIALQRADVATP